LHKDVAFEFGQLTVLVLEPVVVVRVAVCCRALQRGAEDDWVVCYSVLQCVAVCCIVLFCVAACCSMLQRVAACCSVRCKVIQCVVVHEMAACCSMLQGVTVCCSVLQVPQYVAVCSSG